MVESVDEMSEGYRKALIVQLTVQADTELISAPAYWMAARHAPSTNTQVSAHAIIQDELAHANIAYRLLEDLGVSKEELVYGRAPTSSSTPTASTSRWTTGRNWWWPTDSSTGRGSPCSRTFTGIPPTGP
jgi:1,2-phenylacetyl-CoA epoxidase catalytic subunit